VRARRADDEVGGEITRMRRDRPEPHAAREALLQQRIRHRSSEPRQPPVDVRDERDEVGAPQPGRSERHHAARHPQPGELEADPAAQRVTDDVRDAAVVDDLCQERADQPRQAGGGGVVLVPGRR